LTSKDRDAIEKYDEPCARVASSIIAHWLDRLVIPTGQVLIDLPHIAVIYPWLLSDRTDSSNWQATASNMGAEAMLKSVSKHLYMPGFPLARPVVWRNAILNDPDLAEPGGFTYDGFPDLVFCEDTSRFTEFNIARSFSSKLPDSDPQRFVSEEKPNAENEPSSTSIVAYEPSVLFAL
jgi:hypothetical protein